MMTSERSKELVTCRLAAPGQPTLHDKRSGVEGPYDSITEEICRKDICREEVYREEANKLGLNYVVIRGAAHRTRNVYENGGGRTVTVWDRIHQPAAFVRSISRTKPIHISLYTWAGARMH